MIKVLFKAVKDVITDEYGNMQILKAIFIISFNQWNEVASIWSSQLNTRIHRANVFSSDGIDLVLVWISIVNFIRLWLILTCSFRLSTIFHPSLHHWFWGRYSMKCYRIQKIKFGSWVWHRAGFPHYIPVLVLERNFQLLGDNS